MTGLFTSLLTEGVNSLTLGKFLLCTALALVCGGIFALSAHIRFKATHSLTVSLVVLPLIVEMLLLMVNGNLGTGIAVAGAFSLVRFRSAPGKAREIVYLFGAMTAGVACSAGYVAAAVLFSVIVCAVMIGLSFLPKKGEGMKELNITIPETLNYAHAFDDLLHTYTRGWELVSVKTTNMGSMYRLKYLVQLKNEDDVKEMIDAMRCRNGNLEISITDAPDPVDIL